MEEECTTLVVMPACARLETEGANYSDLHTPTRLRGRSTDSESSHLRPQMEGDRTRRSLDSLAVSNFRGPLPADRVDIDHLPPVYEILVIPAFSRHHSCIHVAYRFFKTRCPFCTLYKFRKYSKIPLVQSLRLGLNCGR